MKRAPNSPRHKNSSNYNQIRGIKGDVGTFVITLKTIQPRFLSNIHPRVECEEDNQILRTTEKDNKQIGIGVFLSQVQRPSVEWKQISDDFLASFK